MTKIRLFKLSPCIYSCTYSCTYLKKVLVSKLVSPLNLIIYSMIINNKESFPIIGATDFGALLSRNGDITLCYEGVFANLNTLSADSYQQVNLNFKNAFSSLPAHTLLHAQTFFCFNEYAEGDINLQASSETYLGGANERLLFEKGLNKPSPTAQ